MRFLIADDHLQPKKVHNLSLKVFFESVLQKLVLSVLQLLITTFTFRSRMLHNLVFLFTLLPLLVT